MAELQEILAKGQSQISTHLAQLKQAGLVDDRRTGKNAFYRLNAPAELMDLLRKAASEVPEAAQDRQALRLALRKRQDKMRRYFDELAGKFGRQYVPGRSWKGIAEALLKLMPPMVIADLGAGEGTHFAIDGADAPSASSPSTIPKRWWNSGRNWRASTASAIWNTGWAIWRTCRSAPARWIWRS